MVGRLSLISTVMPFGDAAISFDTSGILVLMHFVDTAAPAFNAEMIDFSSIERRRVKASILIFRDDFKMLMSRRLRFRLYHMSLRIYAVTFCTLEEIYKLITI